MNAQAEQMKGIVKDLAAVIGGEFEGEAVDSSEPVFAAHREEDRKPSPDLKKRKSKKLILNGSREVRPEQVIPFDEDDFQDF